MKNGRTLPWLLVFILLALNGSRGLGQEMSADTSLTQVSFDRLIPSSYPVIHPQFDRLRSTVYPLIVPDIPRVHITENLVVPTVQPLLLTYPIVQPVAAVGAKPAASRRITIPADYSAVKGSFIGKEPALTLPANLRK